MTNDLKETLRELGPEYGSVVARLKSAYEPRITSTQLNFAEPPPSRTGRVVGWTFGYLVAASVLVFLGLGVIFSAHLADSTPQVFTVRVTSSANEYFLAHVRGDEAVKEMIRTQNADGSWTTDFLTKQNAEALRLCKGEAAQAAYKRALRNLRARGIF